MSKAAPIQTNLTSGEISEMMMGRIDTNKYFNGAQVVENFMIYPQGGATRRSGTRHVVEVRDSSRFTRVIPFEFSDEQAYALEFGKNYIRIHNEGHPILDETYFWGTVSAVATNAGSIKVTFNNTGALTVTNNANNGSGLIRVTTSGPHNMITGNRVFISPFGALDPNSVGTWIVTYVSSTTFDLQGSTSTGPFAGTSLVYSRNLISGSANNGSGLIRITTYLPHGRATGDKIYMSHLTPGVNFASTPLVFDWTITVIDDTHFDLQGSTYAAGFDTADDVFIPWIRPGEEVKISGNSGTMALNGTWRVKSAQFRDVVTLANSTYSGTTGGTIRIAYLPIEIETPYSDTDVELLTLKTTQSADVLYIFQGDYPTAKLLRYSANLWKFQNIDFQDGPYLPIRSLAPLTNPENPEQGNLFLDVYLELAAYTHTATVKANVNFTDAVDDNGTTYLEYRKFDDQWRLGLIKLASISASDLKTCTIDIIDNVLLFLDESVRLKQKAAPATIASIVSSTVTTGAGRNARMDPNNEIQTAAAGAAAGTISSQFSNTFGTTDVGKYVRYHTNAATSASHWAQITGIPRAQNGAQASHAAAVTQAAISTSGAGKFVLINETRTVEVVSFKGATAYGVFSSADIGRSIRFGFSGRWTWGKITAFTSASQVTVKLYEDIPRDPHNAANLAGGGRTYDWRLGAWSESTGYPKCGVFHEQRLCLGGGVAEPQTLWTSRSGDFENMAPTELDSTVTDSNGLSYTIWSSKVSPIRWMSSGAVLLVGGAGQEWQGRAASSIQEPLTPSNISLTPQTYYGSGKTADAQKIGSATLFVDRGGQKVRELTYDFALDAFVAKDVSIISEHICRDGGGVRFSDYQKAPVNMLWYNLVDGTLVNITYEKDQEVVAWCRQLIGGSGEVESFCVLPSASGISDYVYLVVKRTINGVVKRYIEYIEAHFKPTSPTDKLNMFFVDSGTTFNLSSRTVFEGLNHLEGEVVQITADGVTVASKTVSGGQITLDVAASVVHVGLQFDTKLHTLPPEAGAALGTSYAKTKRTNKFGIWVVNTMGFKHSSIDSDYQEKILTENGSMFTGCTVCSLEQEHNLEGSFWIKQDLPEPLTILAIAPELKVNEEQ